MHIAVLPVLAAGMASAAPLAGREAESGRLLGGRPLHAAAIGCMCTPMTVPILTTGVAFALPPPASRAAESGLLGGLASVSSRAPEKVMPGDSAA